MLKKIVIMVVGSLSFIALILIISLFNGITIDNISTSSANISKLYLKYDKNLIITVKKLDILPSKDESSTKFDPKYISMANKALSYIQLFKIDDLVYDKQHAIIEYNKNRLSIKSDIVNIDMKFNIIGTTVDFLTTIKNKDISLNIKGDITGTTLYYNISSDKIDNVKWIEKYTTLSAQLHKLLNNQLKFNYIKINTINGIIDIDAPSNIKLNQIIADISIDKPTLKYENYPKVTLKNISLNLEKGNISVNIKKDRTVQENISFNGKINTTIDAKELVLDGRLYYKDIVFSTYDIIKNKILNYSISSNDIEDIKVFQKFVTFPASIEKWAIKRLKSRSTKIENISGKIYLDPFNVDLSTLRVEASMDDIIMDFNPNKAYPLKAKKIRLNFDGKDMKISLTKPTSNDVNLDGSKATIYDMFGDSGLYLDLKTVSALNKTLVRAVASYGVDIVNELKLEQVKGKSDIKVDIDIPFSDKPLDIKVVIKNKNSIISVKDNNLSFTNFDFLYAKNQVKIKQTNLNYQQYDIAINNMVFDIPKSELDLNTTIKDSKNMFLIDLINNTNLDKKVSKGDIIVKFADINNTINIKNKTIPYFVNFDENIKATLPTLGIKYTKNDKIDNLKIDDLKIFEDMIIGMDRIALNNGSLNITSNDLKTIDIDLKMVSKPYIENFKYDFNFKSLVNLENNTTVGNIILNRFRYSDITNISKTTIPYNLRFNKNIKLNLPTLNTQITKENNITNIYINDIRDFSSLITKLNEFNLTKTSIYTTMKDSNNIDLKITSNISKYNIYQKNKRIDNLRLNIDIKDQNKIDIKTDNNMINAFVDITNKLKIKAKISDMGIKYSEDKNKTKYTKNIKLYPPKCEIVKFDLPNIDLNLENGYFQYNKNILNYDNIAILTDHKNIDLNLQENNTTINLSLNDKNITLNAKQIDSNFINNIANEVILNAGYLDLNISGSQCNLDGKILLNKVIVKNIAILKNIFLVINSAPALANPFLILPNAYRFAADGFNLSEYQIKKGLIDFNLNRYKNIFDLKNLYLMGVYSDFIIKGKINLWKKSVNSKVDVVFMKEYSKIIDFVPGLGYVLLGDDKRFSYSVDISGKLNEPSIKTHMAKETILAPYNIIKRVVTWPFD